MDFTFLLLLLYCSTKTSFWNIVTHFQRQGQRILLDFVTVVYELFDVWVSVQRGGNMAGYMSVFFVCHTFSSDIWSGWMILVSVTTSCFRVFVIHRSQRRNIIYCHYHKFVTYSNNESKNISMLRKNTSR
jgi:hypothetical protein